MAGYVAQRCSVLPLSKGPRDLIYLTQKSFTIKGLCGRSHEEHNHHSRPFSSLGSAAAVFQDGY
jgi:hypothetical protein